MHILIKFNIPLFISLIKLIQNLFPLIEIYYTQTENIQFPTKDWPCDRISFKTHFIKFQTFTCTSILTKCTFYCCL